MRKIAHGVLLAATAGLGLLHAAPLMNASNAAIRYEGRYAVDAAGAVRLGFPGVVAHLRFRGTALTLHANASNGDSCFDLSIDGAAPVLLRLHSGDGEYPLVRNSTAGEHVVTLLRRTEYWIGTCTLAGFDPGPDGTLLHRRNCRNENCCSSATR